MVSLSITKDDGTKIELTMEEAKRFYVDLDSLFGAQDPMPDYFWPTPLNPQPTWKPYPWQPPYITTCAGLLDG